MSKLWPSYTVDEQNFSVLEGINESDPEPICSCNGKGSCDGVEAAKRVRDGLELMAIAQPEDWFEKDWNNSIHPWTEQSIGVMAKLLNQFIPVVEDAAKAYIRALKLPGDVFSGIVCADDKSITVEYIVEGHYGDRDYRVEHTIPLRALWDNEAVVGEIIEAQRKEAEEKQLKKQQREAEEQRKAAVAHEQREKETYERLKAKFGGK